MSVDNGFVYRDYGKIWLSYEYWFFGFKRKGKRLLAELDHLGSDGPLALNTDPEGWREQLDSLVQYYRGLYQDG